jgi:hypothetical protein
MYCKKCGRELSDDAVFCQSCGTAQNSAQAAQSQQPIIVNVSNVNTNTNNVGGHDSYPYKSRWAAFFLCVFFGVLGVHRFYVGKIGSGLLWMFTGGICGIGVALDCLLILFGLFRDNSGYPLR